MTKVNFFQKKKFFLVRNTCHFINVNTRHREVDLEKIDLCVYVCVGVYACAHNKICRDFGNIDQPI